MASPLKKLRKRLSLIGVSAVYSVVTSFSNLLISILVVRLLSTEIWGEVVPILLWTGIALNVMSWGNKDFLIRRFSLSPATIKDDWLQSFQSRIIFLLVALSSLIFFPVEFQLKVWIAFYITARFIYLSFESLVVFKRKFSVTISLELSSFLFIAAFILFFHPADRMMLFGFFCIVEILKAFFIIIYFRKQFQIRLTENFSLKYLLDSIPFFIIGFSGLLLGKMDLYAVSFFSSDDDVAKYQVFTGFFGMAQLAGALLLFPFAKNIYRLNKSSLNKLESRFIGAGIILSVFKVLFMFIILTFIYQFHFSLLMYVLAYFYIIPFYFYQMRLYDNSKNNLQWLTITLSCVATFINLLVCMVGIPDLHLEGAMVAVVVSQWVLMLMLNYKPWRIISPGE